MCKIWVVNLISRMIAHEHNRKCRPGKIVFTRLLHMTLRDNQPSRHESSERHLLNANNDPDCQTWICWTYKYTNDRLSNYCGAECMNKESWSVSLQFIHFMSKTPFPSQFSNISITITARHSLPSIVYLCTFKYTSQSWKKLHIMEKCLDNWLCG